MPLIPRTREEVRATLAVLPAEAASDSVLVWRFEVAFDRPTWYRPTRS